MAKKRATRPSAAKSDEEATSIIKLRLKPAEAKIIRLAAAVNNKQPGVYAREVVIEQARKAVRDAKDELI